MSSAKGEENKRGQKEREEVGEGEATKHCRDSSEKCFEGSIWLERDWERKERQRDRERERMMSIYRLSAETERLRD